MTITGQAAPSIAAQILDLAPDSDAPPPPGGPHVPGFTGQGWHSHETMLAVRWLLAHPDAWQQAMRLAEEYPRNPHTVADSLHERIVPRAALDQMAADGLDPARVDWLEIAHEMIERRGDPHPAGDGGSEHANISAQALDLAADGPVPDDPDAIAMFTAHRLDDAGRHLAHASERLDAARKASGDLRDYHTGHVARHLGYAMDAAHELAANLRAHYPAEGADLDALTGTIGLARGYELTSRSGMISLDLPPGTITPVPGGVADHHITVVYLGPDVDDEAFAQACERARAAAAAVPGPLTGTVGGIGTFPPSGSSDGKVPAWAGVVLPGAERLRSDLEDLSASEHKDWKPHVTLAYVEPGEPLPDPVPPYQVSFSHLSVHRGDDEAARFPLGGGPAEMAAAPDGGTAIGLARSVSEQAKTATTAHLSQTICNHLGHTIEHVGAMAADGTPEVWGFNWEHARTHLDGAAEHVGKLREHLADNYPREAGFLKGLESTAQLANPVTITGQAGGPPKGTISGQLDLARGWRDAWRHELRDAHGRWAKTPGGAVPAEEGRPWEFSDQILRAWRQASDPSVKDALNRASANNDGGDVPGTVSMLREAARRAWTAGDGGHFNEYMALAAQIETAAEERESGAGAVREFAEKARDVVPGLLGGGQETWDGSVDLFTADEKPHILAYMGWDGRMGFQSGLAGKLKAGMSGTGRVDDPRAFQVVLHELMHGTIGGRAGQGAKEWEALAPADQDTLEKFGILDSLSVTGGAQPVEHTLAQVQHGRAEPTQAQVDDLTRRGLLRKSSTTSSTWNPDTGESSPPVHSWMLTDKARAIIPGPPETYQDHRHAYQDPKVASIEEGFNELGAAQHAPEFFAKLGIGDRPTQIMAVEHGHPADNPEYQRKQDEIVAALRQQWHKLAGGPPQKHQAANGINDAIYDVQNGNTEDALKDILPLGHTGDAGDWNAFGTIREQIMALAETPMGKQATMTEYAKRLAAPARILDGNAWGAYGWQTAAALNWVAGVARAEGKTIRSKRVTELADEINREGPAGKVPAMARQVLRAAGVPDQMTDAGQLSELVADRIRGQWPEGTTTVPFAGTLRTVKQYAAAAAGRSAA